MAEPLIARPALRTDAFLGGRLQLRQPASGHRAGTDAVLLSAAAPADFSGLALDVGAGVGAAGLALAALWSSARIGLIESDPETAALASENIILNGLSARGAVFEADVLSAASRRGAGLEDEKAGLVITNPPFFDPRRTRLSPDPARRRAHAMPREAPRALASWIAASLALLQPGGLLVMIHRPEALREILEALAGRAGATTILPIHPRSASPATRILVRGRKGSRAPLSIAQPLILHDEHGFTDTAETLHRGAASIAW